MKTYQQKYNDRSEITVQILFALIIVGALSYSAILLSVTFSAIEKKQAQTSIKKLSSELALTERVYGDKVSTLSSVTLRDIGFYMAQDTTFAIRKDDVASFALLYER